MEKILLVYLERYNQYYKPIEIDTDNKVCKMVVAKNKRDKSITRNMIARVERYPDWKFIVMKNQHIEAEKNFVSSMHSKGEYNRKINELIDFKRNGLMDSEVAMAELTRIFHKGFKDVKSEQDRRFRQKVKSLYEELMIEQSKNDNKRSYDQRVPTEIISLAKDKGLLIERNDEYIAKKGSRVKPTKKELAIIRANKPCGYLIRDMDKKAIAANGYKFTSAQVVEFVQKYTPYNSEKENEDLSKKKKKYEEFKHVLDTESGVVYRVIYNRHNDNTLIMVKTEKQSAKSTMQDVKDAGYNIEIMDISRKETPLEWFYRMTNSDNPKHRLVAVKFSTVEGITERGIVIDVLKKMVANDLDSDVIRVATDSLKRLGATEAETVVISDMRKEDSNNYATAYKELLDSLSGRLHNKKQKSYEKNELSVGVSIETLKKIKSLGVNVCVIKTSDNKGYNIARYPVSKKFHTLSEIDKWADEELSKKADGASEKDNLYASKTESKKSESKKSNKREFVLNKYVYWTCQYTGAVKVKILKILDDDKVLADTSIKKQAPIVRDIKFIFVQKEHAEKAMKDWESAERKRKKAEKEKKKLEQK